MSTFALIHGGGDVGHAHGPPVNEFVEFISENNMLSSKSVELGQQRRARSVDDHTRFFPLAHDTVPAADEGLRLDSRTCDVKSFD
jgi:hypothetical protein